jgi:deazaflavin-dependent oxidoreductase (nitroreductase family)
MAALGSAALARLRSFATSVVRYAPTPPPESDARVGAWLRVHFNKRVTNRIQGLYAWLLPPWAVILHRGRRSGREYRTPLFAFRRDRTLVIALLYGQESDWLRNLKAGGGHVIRGGRTFTVGPPEIVDASASDQLLRSCRRRPAPIAA